MNYLILISFFFWSSFMNSSSEKVIFFDPSLAVKIGLPRQIRSGSPGDTDVYGAQQHAPMLGIDLDM